MKRCDKLVDVGRRAFFARTAATAAGVAVSTALPALPAVATPSLARVTYPVTRLGTVAELKVNEPKDITYPDGDSPGVLIKLGKRVEGGSAPTATSSPTARCVRTRDTRLGTVRTTAR